MRPALYTDVPRRMHAAFRAERPPWHAWQEPTRVEREWQSMGVGWTAASADQRADGTRGQLGAAEFCWWGAGAGRRASWARRRGPASALACLSSARAGKRRRCSQWGTGAWPGDLAETMHTVEWDSYWNSCSLLMPTTRVWPSYGCSEDDAGWGATACSYRPECGCMRCCECW